MAARVLVVVAAVAAMAYAGRFPARLAPKYRNGAPSEFAQHVVPDPAAGGVATRTARMWGQLAAADAGAAWTTHIPVDHHGFTFAIVSSELDSLQVALKDPSGAAVPLDKFAHPEAALPVGDNANYDRLLFWELPNSSFVGTYELTVTGPSELADVDAGQLLVIVDSESNDMLYTQIGSYRSLLVNQQVTLRGHMAVEPSGGFEYAVKPMINTADTIKTAQLEVRFPDGHWETAPMHDDGLHGDGAANDGEYAAAFTATAQGKYTVQATFTGSNTAGNFVRTSEHLLAVAEPVVQLASKALGVVRRRHERLDVYLLLKDTEAAALAEQQQTQMRAYAEVYGRDAATGEPTPLAWMGAIVPVASGLAGRAVKLELDLKWLPHGNGRLPLTLRNVRLTETEFFIPISEVDSIDLVVLNEDELDIGALSYDGTVSAVMRTGIPPDYIVNASASNDVVRPIMIHGYCSAHNPWAENPDIWGPNALYFEDFSQSREHNHFAELVNQFVAQHDVTKCVVVGFSQGGPVSAHLYDSVWSCLDANTNPGRKQSSLASPYLGCTGAGGYADFLKILGGCGACYDLSLDGAPNWAAGISQDTWEEVHFYTTRSKPGWINPNGYCQLVTNMVLDQPNDGVAETKYSQPPLANNHGETQGECHIANMNYPPSYQNRGRLQEMAKNMAL